LQEIHESVKDGDNDPQFAQYIEQIEAAKETRSLANNVNQLRHSLARYSLLTQEEAQQKLSDKKGLADFIHNDSVNSLQTKQNENIEESKDQTEFAQIKTFAKRN
jgi:hypothetical protein